MRDLMVGVAMLALIWLAFANGFIAFLIWGWAGLISIQSYTYGFISTIPLVQLFAITTLLMVFFKKDAEQVGWKKNATLILFLLLAFQSILSAIFAYDGVSRNWELCTNLLKTLLYCALMPMLLTNRLRIHAFVVMVVLGVTFHGMVDGLKFLSSAGGHLARGIVKYGDNNHYALILAMVMPLALYLYLYTEKRLVKNFFLSVLTLNILAVIATQSRGGLVCLIALAAWTIYHSKRKFLGTMALALCTLMILQLAPDSWGERMSTINTAEQDNSFMTRVAAWKKSSAIALENPLLGGGFHAVQAPNLADQFNQKQGLFGFIDTPNPYNFAAHSIYFETMGDMGFIGFSLLLMSFFNAFFIYKKIKADASNTNADVQWAADLASLTMASIFVFAIGGALLSAAYFELPYILFMLMQVVKIEVNRQIYSAEFKN
ncbi:putative O-glycosylation ligase, exosortase A system-associated [Rhodoferax sp. U11-2br]|uniref:putative O-glycosylation ligase, exosortase A system-associated n=1 Tax=Rhodoferax sp. U11-2br TaxID=2838878 RepID=UPI001BEC4C04|nr:putative O-glycosylation ligase, exosortase A system-associated [Rhodoferax sp. U11-2br]MBT3067047.1 putative O-glycosylation ligase, exosortase A system-associated [Rhodoferax sp. U11-2br]